MRLSVGQTDRQTDGQTKFSSLLPRLHSMQRGNKNIQNRPWKLLTLPSANTFSLSQSVLSVSWEKMTLPLTTPHSALRVDWWTVFGVNGRHVSINVQTMTVNYQQSVLGVFVCSCNCCSTSHRSDKTPGRTHGPHNIGTLLMHRFPGKKCLDTDCPTTSTTSVIWYVLSVIVDDVFSQVWLAGHRCPSSMN